MNAVSPVLSAASPRWNSPAYRVTSPGSAGSPAPAVKTNGANGVARQAGGIPAAQPLPAAAQTNLPLGLLQSVNQPPANNATASLDYHDLRIALQSGNLAAAQQAYLRLQNDLTLPYPTLTGTATTAVGNVLDARG
jgi:hypothetical protein